MKWTRNRRVGSPTRPVLQYDGYHPLQTSSSCHMQMAPLSFMTRSAKMACSHHKPQPPLWHLLLALQPTIRHHHRLKGIHQRGSGTHWIVSLLLFPRGILSMLLELSRGVEKATGIKPRKTPSAIGRCRSGASSVCVMIDDSRVEDDFRL
jgi:hypothetical protein